MSRGRELTYYLSATEVLQWSDCYPSIYRSDLDKGGQRVLKRRESDLLGYKSAVRLMAKIIAREVGLWAALKFFFRPR